MGKKIGIIVALVVAIAAAVYYLRPAPYGLEERPSGTLGELSFAPVATPWQARPLYQDVQVKLPLQVVFNPHAPSERFALGRLGTVTKFHVAPNQPELGSKPEVVLDITDVVSSKGDGGMLALAFHPQKSHLAYLLYSAEAGEQIYNRLSRFRINSSGKFVDELVMIDLKDDHRYHNGGTALFGPDGFLYASFGDEGISRHRNTNPQSIHDDFFSGILRLDVDQLGGKVSHAPKTQPEFGKTQGYFIPSDNPFVGVKDALEEYWALGFRNPYRMSFDPDDGSKLWVGDVGSNRLEEINLVSAGSNGQWSYREGSAPNTNSIYEGKKPTPFYGEELEPFYEYEHAYGDIAVIGGVVYTGSQYPALRGQYIFADHGSRRVWAIDRSPGSRPTLLAILPGNLVGSIDRDPRGELVISEMGDGKSPGNFYTLEPATVANVAPPRLSRSGLLAGTNPLRVQKQLVEYELNQASFANYFNKRFFVYVPPPHAITLDDRGLAKAPTGTIFVKFYFREQADGTQAPLELNVTQITDQGASLHNFAWSDEISDGLPVTADQAKTVAHAERQISWQHSASNCAGCHNSANGYVLGFTPGQLNLERAYRDGRRPDQQIRSLAHIGLIDSNQKWQESPTFSSNDTAVAVAANYLEANCAYCHQAGGLARGELVSPFTVKKLQAMRQSSHTLLSGNPPRILERIQSTAPGVAMPPLLRSEVDVAGAAVIKEWLAQ